MNTAMLCAVPWWAQGMAIVFIAVCVFLVILVLLQKGRGGGLASAFGGEGGQSAFGSKTGDVFTWVTIVVVTAFGLLAILLTLFYKPAVMEEYLPQNSSLAAPKDIATDIPTSDAAGSASTEKNEEKKSEETKTEVSAETMGSADAVETPVAEPVPAVGTTTEETKIQE